MPPSTNGALSMAKIVGIAATRIQALYRSYRIRKSFIEHRDLLLKHERLLDLKRRQKRHLPAKSDNDKKRIVHNAASFLGHVIEEKHKTAIQLKMKEAENFKALK